MILLSFAILLPLAQAASAVASWELTEVQRLGAIDGSTALSAIPDLILADSGRLVVVAQPLDLAIKAFDSHSGEVAYVFGGMGGGPGEFLAVSSLSISEDSIAVADLRQQRIVFFLGMTGEHLSTRRVESAPLAQTRRPAMPRSVTPSQGFWATSPANALAVANGAVSTSPVLLLNGDGRLVRHVGNQDISGTIGTATLGDQIIIFKQPLVRKSLVAFAADGGSACIVETPPTTAASSASFKVTRVDFRGDTIYSKEYKYRPARVSSDERGGVFRWFSETYGGNVSGRLIKKAVDEEVIFPEYRPPFADVLITSDGGVWLKETPGFSSDASTWLVLNPEGAIQAHVRAPPTTQIHWVDGENVWGVVRDDLDIPFVVRFRIEPR